MMRVAALALSFPVFVVVLFIALSGAGNTHADVLTLTSQHNDADTWVDSSTPSADRGLDTKLLLARNSSQSMAFFTRWSLASLPANADVVNAKLRVYVASEQMEATDVWRAELFHVYQFPAFAINGQPWTQGNGNSSIGCSGSELCWDTRPTSANQMNLTPQHSVNLGDGLAGTWIDLPVTGILQEAVGAAESTVTILAQVTKVQGDDGLDQLVFRSREYPETDKRPTLIIEVAQPAGASPTPTPTSNATVTPTATPTPEPPPDLPNPYQVHLSTSTGDPSTEATFTWKTPASSSSFLRIGTTSAVYSITREALQYTYRNLSAGTDVCCMQVVQQTGLSPATTYYYQVGSDAKGWSNQYSFRTAAPKGNESPFTVAAFGDQGAMGGQGAAVADSVFAQHPNLVLVAGDLSYCPDQTCVDTYFGDTVADLASQVPFMSAPGNHEFFQPDDMVTYTSRVNFPGRPVGELCAMRSTGCSRTDVPELWYSFNWGNVHFMSINLGESHWKPFSGSETIGPGKPEYEWFRSDLQAASQDPDIDWIVVLSHYSLYNRGKDEDHASDDEARAVFEPLIQQYGVDLWIGAHQHSYQRTLPVGDDGRSVDTASCGGAPFLTCNDPAYPIYFTVGTGGRSLYTNPTIACGTPANCDLWSAPPTLIGVYGNLRLSFSGRTLTADFVGLTGGVLDSVTINKSVSPRPTPTPTPTPTPSPTATPSPTPTSPISVANLADTRIDSLNPDKDYGTATQLVVGRTSSRELAFAMRWDLSVLPPGSEIRSATLQMTIANESMEANDRWRLDFYHIYEYPGFQVNGQKWSEGNSNGSACQGSELCWNTRPTTDQQMNPSPVASADLPEPAIGSTITFDVTGAVRAAAARGEQTVNLLARVQRLSGDNGLDEVAFRSKEHSAAPSLTITFSSP